MDKPKRKPNRLKEYDYSTPGYYFITICTQNRKNILSIVGEGSPLPMLTQYGEIVDKFILELDNRYESISTDKYVIMPNHIHILLNIKNNGRGHPSPTVNAVVGWFKYITTKEINKVSNTQGKRVFQRSFYDHIIRGEQDYKEIWQYIDTNPTNWNEDCFYLE